MRTQVIEILKIRSKLSLDDTIPLDLWVNNSMFLLITQVMMKSLCLLLMVFTSANTVESKLFELFVKDVIDEWKLNTPTIIVDNDIPDTCKTLSWSLCLANELSVQELVLHLQTNSMHRKQDAVIFSPDQENKELIAQLSKHVPSIFTSNCPVFMPNGYEVGIRLRLDSNIIFYIEETSGTYTLLDKFAVKGSDTIVLTLANWNLDEGVIFKLSKNRWDRRTDLKGAVIKNCLLEYGWWAQFTRDVNGNITGSMGYFQDKLFYITDRLNMTVETVARKYEDPILLKNGTWIGIMGLMQKKEVDVFSMGMGIHLLYSSIIDFPFATNRKPITLIAARPRGAAHELWVYVRVFGIFQWIIFAMLLVLLACALSLVIVIREDDTGRSFGTKKGGNDDNELTTPYSAFALVYLYTIQMGSHTSSKQLSTRLLTITVSLLTFFMFVYYETDITAEMTSGLPEIVRYRFISCQSWWNLISGPPEIPIKNFADVIEHEYMVTTFSDYYKTMLETAKPGSAKKRVFDHNFKYKDPNENSIGLMEAIDEVVNVPKMLLYCGPFYILPHIQDRTLMDQLSVLKMDDVTFGTTTLPLHKDSEFLEVFNHFIIKGMETGFLERLHRRYYTDLFTSEDFGMNEPQPLGLNNVMFCFSFVALGVCFSFALAIMEKAYGLQKGV